MNTYIIKPKGFLVTLLVIVNDMSLTRIGISTCVRVCVCIPCISTLWRPNVYMDVSILIT